MAESQEAIKKKINSYINRHGGDFPKWYVGITNDVERRLGEHNVKDNDPHTSEEAYTENSAREVEKYYIEEKETQGGSGGGSNPTFVYAYKTAPHTDEKA